MEDLHSCTDAQVWATEFCKRFPDSDHEVMMVWFANAIMAGHDNRENFHRETTRHAEALIRELEVALPVLQRPMKYGYNMVEQAAEALASVKDSFQQAEANLQLITMPCSGCQNYPIDHGTNGQCLTCSGENFIPKVES